MISNKILILQFMENRLCFLKNLLRRYGYQVVQSTITEDIIQVVLNIAPDVIILNCFVEEEKSLEACKALNSHPATNEIPIIAQFHGASEKNRQHYIENNIRDFILQPYHEEELILKIDNQLKIVQLQRSLKASQEALEESLQTIEEQKNELENNLALAAKIQESLIPKSLGNIPNCSFLMHFQPSGRVGGDIFDVFMLDEEHVGLYMIDVMGHGVASSMLAVALSEFLILDVERGTPLKRKISDYPYYQIVPPKEVISHLNQRFTYSRYNHYFTMVYMVLNVKTGELKYVRAGHPAPVLIKNDGEIKELNGYGTPIGFEFNEEYEEKTVLLDSGDTIVIYTDGLTEVTDEDGIKLDYDTLLEYLRKEMSFENHHYTLRLKKLARSHHSLKDDLSILEMKWLKFL